MVTCMICDDPNELCVKHFDLYIIGSEGLNVCHECEMKIVNYVRDLKSIAAKSKLIGVKIGRRMR